MSSYITLSPNIILCPNQPPDFNHAVEEAIKIIASGEVGKKLLEKIGKVQHKVFILSGTKTKTTFDNRMHATTRGVGSGAELRMSLETQPTINTFGKKCESPFYIQLAHELIHVYHGFYGKKRNFEKVANEKLWRNAEELYTVVGSPPKKNKQRTKPKISENAIRKEHGLEERYTHFFATKLDDPSLAPKIKFHSTALRTQTVCHSFFSRLATEPSLVRAIKAHATTPLPNIDPENPPRPLSSYSIKVIRL